MSRFGFNSADQKSEVGLSFLVDQETVDCKQRRSETRASSRTYEWIEF